MAVKISVPPETLNPEPETNMCFGCKVHCCTLQIDLTVYDIARISHFEKPVPFLVYVDAKRDDPFAFRAFGKLVKFVLLKKQDGLCVFFDGRKNLYCTIEDSKPSVCLAYPMTLTASGQVVIRPNVVCPTENLRRADFNKMSKSVLEDYFWERERYYEFVADWNQTARGDESPEAFLRFAASEMDLEKTPPGRIIRKIKRRLRWLRA
jgi:Fe-S-cluster containining protein